MSFTSSPVDGDVITSGDLNYIYKASNNAWVRYDPYSVFEEPIISGAGVLTIDCRYAGHKVLLDKDITSVVYTNWSDGLDIQMGRIDLTNDGVGSHTVVEGAFGENQNGLYKVNTTAGEAAIKISYESWDFGATVQTFCYESIDNSGFGTAYYETNLVGDGVETDWDVAHLLNADNPMVVVRSAASGTSFVKGEDFNTEDASITIVDANNLTAVIDPAIPNGDTWRLSVVALDKLIAG